MVEPTAIPVPVRARTAAAEITVTVRSLSLPKRRRSVGFPSRIRRRCTCTRGSSLRGGQQIDQAVELPERVWCVAVGGVHHVVAVNLGRSVAVGDVTTVGVDVELIDGLP